MEPRAVEGLLCRGMLQVMSGHMAPGMLSAIAAGARAYVAVREAGEVEERLSSIEATLAQSAPTDLRRVR
jgi:tRNA U55 pseudouridine synthase TruB